MSQTEYMTYNGDYDQDYSKLFKEYDYDHLIKKIEQNAEDELEKDNTDKYLRKYAKLLEESNNSKLTNENVKDILSNNPAIAPNNEVVAPPPVDPVQPVQPAPYVPSIGIKPKNRKNLTEREKEFNRHFDNVVRQNPEYAKHRKFLTNIARIESGFDSKIQNQQGAPAYGYFQFMQDGKKYNNIKHYSGLSIEQFRNNPEAQIKAAHKLAEEFLKTFNTEDLKEAARQGYTEDGLLAGAWMGGVGGVRKALKGIDTDDKFWSKEGIGSSVMTYMKQFSKNMEGSTRQDLYNE